MREFYGSLSYSYKIKVGFLVKIVAAGCTLIAAAVVASYTNSPPAYAFNPGVGYFDNPGCVNTRCFIPACY